MGGEGEGGRRGRGRETSIFDDTWGARCYNHHFCELLPPWPIDGCLKASHLSAMAAEVCRSSDYSSELLKKPGLPTPPRAPGNRGVYGITLSFPWNSKFSEVPDLSSMGHFVDLGQENASAWSPSPGTYLEKHRPRAASGGGAATNPSCSADPGRHPSPATRPHAQE